MIDCQHLSIVSQVSSSFKDFLSAPKTIPSPTNIKVLKEILPIYICSHLTSLFFCSPETFFKTSSIKGCDECTWGTCCCTLFADLADFHKEMMMRSRIIMAAIFIQCEHRVCMFVCLSVTFGFTLNMESPVTTHNHL